MKSFVAALLAFMAGIFPTIVADEDLRYLEAFKDYYSAGPSHYFTDNVPDLSAYFLDNTINSICYTGVWELFSETNYEGNWIGGFQGIDSCHTLSSKNAVSSLRYAGSPYGLNDVYYNLYEGTYYGGAEFKGDTNAETVGALDQNVSSIIITGQSPWTFFTDLQFTGEAVCVYPRFVSIGDNGIELVVNRVHQMSELDLPDNSIRSVAKGCLSERIVRLPPSEASVRPEGDHKLTNSVH